MAPTGSGDPTDRESEEVSPAAPPPEKLEAASSEAPALGPRRVGFAAAAFRPSAAANLRPAPRCSSLKSSLRPFAVSSLKGGAAELELSSRLGEEGGAVAAIAACGGEELVELQLITCG